MNVIGLFTKYFLILMLIQAFVYIVIDYRYFYSLGVISAAKKSRNIGIGVAIISIALYVIRILLT